MEDKKRLFYEKLDEYESKFLQEKCVLSSEKYNLILECPNTEKGIKAPGGARFKHWEKAIFRKTTIGEKEVLICLKTECPVVTRDGVFEVISKCHVRTEHSGRDKTWHEVKSSYAGICYPLIGLFIETCSTCSTRKPLKKPTAGKRIISLGFLTRMQVDIIDMTSHPDNDFKYIMHARDNFSKFSWAYPLTQKTAENVANKLMLTFSQFGPPRILQLDNGREFVARVISELRNTWTNLIILQDTHNHKAALKEQTET
jgi:hypothetical protein